MSYFTSKAWLELENLINKAKLKNFDYGEYFHGKTPKAVYADYKKLASQYVRMFYENKGPLREYQECNDNIRFWVNQMKERPEAVEECKMHLQSLQLERADLRPNVTNVKKEMSRLYQEANKMEHYIRGSGYDAVFIDLGSLGTSDYQNESHSGELSGLEWMESPEFLRLAYPLRLEGDRDRDFDSIAYNANRIKSGRTMPGNLVVGEETYGWEDPKAGAPTGRNQITAHQSRHRNYGNIQAFGPKSEMPVAVLREYGSKTPFKNLQGEKLSGAVPEARRNNQNAMNRDEIMHQLEEFQPQIERALQRVKNSKRAMMVRHANPEKHKRAMMVQSKEGPGFRPPQPDKFDLSFMENPAMEKAFKKFKSESKKA